VICLERETTMLVLSSKGTCNYQIIPADFSE